jgi:hypothetical protein
MTHYAIVEKATERIVQMHAHYVFGNAQPVACTDEELQAALSELGDPATFEIHRAPDGFDPADCEKTLRFDAKKQQLQVAIREPRKSKKGDA